jgi:hypothetical protein
MSDRGLGDMICMSGAAVRLSEIYDRLTFPCHDHHERSVRAIFALCPKVEILVLREDKDNGTRSISPEDLRGDVLSTTWLVSGVFPDPALSKAENDYASLGLDYSVRWDCCPITEAAKLVEQIPPLDEPFAFVHDDPARGFYIQGKYIQEDLRIVRPDPGVTDNILAYCSLIAWASEGHYIDSSFRHLAESIETSGVMFYHEYARRWSARRGEPEAPSRKKWTVLNS